ncbi:Casanova [Linnemannia exigua]|uniref:Casanova n=1 Tax=Linnemannia exigua TaxID=604196 RepID=A0AAD4DBD2_9FUNG|nr:Casanova [Linnemannia exigua]
MRRQHNVKMVVSCRTTLFSRGYQGLFHPHGADKYHDSLSHLFEEATIVPFTEDDVKAYIHQYICGTAMQDLAIDRPRWTVEQFMDSFSTITGLSGLVKNPFVLWLALRVLPSLLNGALTSTAKNGTTRAQLLDRFFENWVGVNESRIRRRTKLKPKVFTVFQDLCDSEGGFKGCVADFLTNLSAAMFEHQGYSSVVNYEHVKEEITWKGEFFGRTIKSTLLRDASPLIRAGDQYRFIHDTFFDYFRSLAIYTPDQGEDDGSDDGEDNDSDDSQGDDSNNSEGEETDNSDEDDSDSSEMDDSGEGVGDNEGDGGGSLGPSDLFLISLTGEGGGPPSGKYCSSGGNGGSFGGSGDTPVGNSGSTNSGDGSSDGDGNRSGGNGDATNGERGSNGIFSGSSGGSGGSGGNDNNSNGGKDGSKEDKNSPRKGKDGSRTKKKGRLTKSRSSTSIDQLSRQNVFKDPHVLELLVDRVHSDSRFEKRLFFNIEQSKLSAVPKLMASSSWSMRDYPHAQGSDSANDQLSRPTLPPPATSLPGAEGKPQRIYGRDSIADELSPPVPQPTRVVPDDTRGEKRSPFQFNGSVMLPPVLTPPTSSAPFSSSSSSRLPYPSGFSSGSMEQKPRQIYGIEAADIPARFPALPALPSSYEPNGSQCSKRHQDNSQKRVFPRDSAESLQQQSYGSGSSSATPFTPTRNSPAIAYNLNQPDVFHDSSRNVGSANNKDGGDEQYMELDQQSTDQPKAITSRTARTASKPFKIPRPPNSFMLYRAENGKKYPGLVATELSAKLGEAWRKEPQDIRDRYEELAEQAKWDHALKYPNYKFAPVKRGAGKRALKLAAEAIASEMAEMDAATLLISMASMAPAPARVPMVAAVASNSSSNNCDRSMYSPASPTHSSAPVSAMGTRPKAQRPIKVASLNKSNVPISNDNAANVTVSSNGTEGNTETATSTTKDAGSEQEALSSDDMNAGARAGAGTGAGEGASQQQQQQQQSSRAYPQLSPPLILFREALARRSPQLASSLVAQIVINVWLGVTEELRERYEIMAESDPRFKDKTGYIKHVPVTSGTPTTASEAMMANQIAQLLRKSAAADHFTLPQSNKRKRAMSKTHGPGARFARIAPAPTSVSFSIPVPAAVVMPNEHSPINLEMDPIPEHVESVPAPREASPIVSSTRESPVHVETAPAPAPFPPTKTTPVSATATAPTPARNDFTPATVIPMPMPSPNRRQTRANAAFVAMAGFVPPKSTSTSSSSSAVSISVKLPKAKKVVPPKLQKVKMQEDKVTPANRPVRRIVRPSKYSS